MEQNEANSENISSQINLKVFNCYDEALNSAIQNEVSFVNDMEYLHMLLQHPGLKGNVLSLDKCVQHVSNMLIAHRNLRDELSDKTCLVSCAFFNFMPHLKIYIDYASCVERVNICIKKLTVFCNGELWKRSSELLLAPINQLSKYKEIINQLRQFLPEQEGKPLQDIFEAIEKTVIEIQAICSASANALKILQIQRNLIDGQPKIFDPGRIFLKEGYLFKVKKNGRGYQQRLFILLSDILLCCKKIKRSQYWHKKSMLSCRSVIPLSTCSVQTVYEVYDGCNAFEISWDSNSYKLFSKVEDITQSWVDDIKNAIKCHKELLLTEEKLKFSSLRRSTLLRRQVQPLMQRRASESNILDQPSSDTITTSSNAQSKPNKKLSIKQSFKMLFR